MTNETLEKVAVIGKTRLEEIKKEQEAKDTVAVKKEAESKGAATVETTEITKTEGQVDKDKPEAKPAAAEPLKVEKRKEDIQAEIDKLISDKKALEAENLSLKESKEKIAVLESKLEKLETAFRKPSESEIKQTVKKAQDSLISKYFEEDKELPREEKREMSKDELAEWMAEDIAAANEWLTDRQIRRKDELKVIESDVRGGRGKAISEEFVKAQQESRQKLVTKYPSLQKAFDRGQELFKQGKNEEEIYKTLCSEFEHFKVMDDIISSDQNYITSKNGPELVMNEMDKRLSKPKSKAITLTEEELQKKVQEGIDAEKERVDAVDTGVSSTRSKSMKETVKQTEFEMKQENLATKAGISKEKLDAIKKRRETIPGASLYTHQHDREK